MTLDATRDASEKCRDVALRLREGEAPAEPRGGFDAKSCARLALLMHVRHSFNDSHHRLKLRCSNHQIDVRHPFLDIKLES